MSLQGDDSGSGNNSRKRKGKDKDTSNALDPKTKKLLVCVNMYVAIYYVQHDALLFIYHILMEVKFLQVKIVNKLHELVTMTELTKDEALQMLGFKSSS